MTELRALAKSERLGIYEELIPKLEILSAGFINRAFLRMAWSPQLGERFTTQELAERLDIVPAHRRLFERLIGILAEEGLLKPEGDCWIVLRPLEAQSSDLQLGSGSIETTVSGMYRGDSPSRPGVQDGLMRCCVELVTRCSFFSRAATLIPRMPCIVRSPFARALNTAVRHVVVKAMQDAPKDRTVRILEIGAGTGGTTSFLLPAPARRTHTLYVHRRFPSFPGTRT